jgi:predicted nucleotidyltransferase
MRADDPNLPILIRVAEALGELREELVFVGGCAAGLLITDPVVSGVRATQDVDAIVKATSFTQFHAVEMRLVERGFVHDAESGVICRWRHRASGSIFDLMPTDPAVLGFANRWYPEAVKSAIDVALHDALHIRLISAPAFVATKLEAFATRGRSDVYSHDLEDILVVVDGRPELAGELAGASDGMRVSVRKQFAALLQRPDFDNALQGLIADSMRAGTVFAPIA